MKKALNMLQKQKKLFLFSKNQLNHKQINCNAL